MKKTLEKLWNDYLVDECATINTEEERALTKKVSDKYEAVSDLLTKEQAAAMEVYVDASCEINCLFTKKAFLKGCEFSASFLLEAANF